MTPVPATTIISGTDKQKRFADVPRTVFLMVFKLINDRLRYSYHFSRLDIVKQIQLFLYGTGVEQNDTFESLKSG
jgi:hypothetical protein